jgi:glycosyltransferase involved in cell wall biosynthesis
MVAVISRLIYPDPAANAIQTIQMAAAFADETEATALFVHDLAVPEAEVRAQYGIGDNRLQIWQMHAERWPSLFYSHGKTRFLTYNTAVASVLALHPKWRRLARQEKVLFVRSRLEILYWGLMRPYLWGLRDWLFVCELHDLQLPLRDEKLGLYKLRSQRARRITRALRNYDLVLTVSRGLAKDIRRITTDTVRPAVVPLCSGLQRLSEAPQDRLKPEQVVLGYIGTVDVAHGVSDLFDALRLLPESYVLRVVGRVRERAREQVEAAVASGRVQLVGPVPYTEVGCEIDQCDIVLAPAGETVHATKYRSPLKLFDYMARGKPIIAADVPCHREVLLPNYNALLYQRGDAEHLAQQIQLLASNQELRRSLAGSAWQTSSAHTYAMRANQLLSLIDDARSQWNAMGAMEG